ncbi:PqqD family protein [Streptacidiphilus albus]|jgi:hypothetical protein|uniref:PqqD family protein n=1 Tax=Streptacidiphilus albus TaxID=105425 RepID=UPI0005AAABAE|nr:PqqD family protein [Streptacidiphilus albus]
MTKQISPDVVWTEAGDEVRLYDTNTGEFQRLNESGAVIWRMLAQPTEETDVADRLVAEYAPEDSEGQRVIRRDVARFIDDMTKRSLLVDANAD